MLQSNIQCAAKKYPLKFFCHFLCSRSKFFTWNFTHLLIIHDHIKFAKQHCITFNYDKVIKFLGWPHSHFWRSRNVCVAKDASYFIMWCKNPSWFEQQNKQFADTGSVYHQLSCTYLIAEWSFTYQSCNHSLWLVIPDHLQCLLAHGGSVNSKMLYQKHQETVNE